MAISDQGRTERSGARPTDMRSTPMSHQYSGSHGYEMYPQQFVRLVGCHDAALESLRRHEDEKLH